MKSEQEQPEQEQEQPEQACDGMNACQPKTEYIPNLGNRQFGTQSSQLFAICGLGNLQAQLPAGTALLLASDGQPVLYNPNQMRIDAPHHRPQSTISEVIRVAKLPVRTINFSGRVTTGSTNTITTQQTPTLLNNARNYELEEHSVNEAARTPDLVQNLTEEVYYVNAKQYHRILKRRMAKAKLEASGRISNTRPRYLHESRHKHAINRARAKSGRFQSGSDGERQSNSQDSTSTNSQASTSSSTSTSTSTMQSLNSK